MSFALVANLNFFTSYGQCISPDFDVDSDLCVDQSLEVSNHSSESAQFEWDFCAGEMSLIPTKSIISTIGSSLPIDQTVQWYNDKYYHFVSDRNGNKIYRVVYSNTATVTNLGNPSGLLSSPDRILLHEEGGHWYGLMTNDQATNNLIFLDFGVTLDNTP
ncbi:hypothetical protein, partial [Marinoscillum luteum]